MPGINISTATRTGATTTTVRESSQAFFVGKAFRGPTDTAIKINGIEEFELHFGGYVNGYYLHPTVETFFEEGGSQCWVARAVGSSAVAADLTLFNDTDEVILLAAHGEGTWADDAGSPDRLSVSVTDGTAANTRIVRIFKGGKQVMSTGTDGVDDDPDDTELAAGLDLFLDSYGTGVVSCPETTGINDDLIAHAQDMNRLTFLHADSGMDPNDGGDYADLIDITQTIQGEENAEHVAFFHPWIYVPTTIVGVSRLIPPDGYAAGARARAHNTVGPHQPGAGAISSARFVSGVEFAIGSTLSNSLDSESINAVRIINNAVRIYGARSCSGDLPNFRYTTGQDVLNHVVVESYRSLEDVLFRPIDSRNEMFIAIKQRLQSVMEGLRSIGAIYEAFDANGRRIDYGYTVVCDSSINPLSQLIDGTVTARVGLRVTGIGDSIQVDIIKSSLTASVV